MPAETIQLRSPNIDVVPPELIGGAVVYLPINTFDAHGSRYIPRGTVLSRDEVLAMANQERLQSAGYLRITMRSPVETVGDLHIVHLGKGQYDVIRGIKINDKPLSKDDAEELATKP